MTEHPDDISDLIDEWTGQVPAKKREAVPLTERILAFIQKYDEEYQGATCLVLRELGETAKSAKNIAKKLSFVNVRLVQFYIKAKRKKKLIQFHRAFSELLDKLLKAF